MESVDEEPTAEARYGLRSQRPLGVAILSILTGLLGILLLAAFVILVANWRENNEFALQKRMAPSVFWVLLSASVVLTFAACIGMWRGTKWGWWLACCGMVMSVGQNFLFAVQANVSHGDPSLSTFLSIDSVKFIVRGLVYALVLAYWLSAAVRWHFRVEKTGPIKAVVLSAVCGFGITTVIVFVLQLIYFLSRMS